MSRHSLLTTAQNQTVAAIVAPHSGVAIRCVPAVLDWRSDGLLRVSLDDYRGTSVALWVWPDHSQDAVATQLKDAGIPYRLVYPTPHNVATAMAKRGSDMPLPEFSYVTTAHDIATPDGILSAGVKGTILSVDPATRTYMVEFYEPLCSVETVTWDESCRTNSMTCRRRNYRTRIVYPHANGSSQSLGASSGNRVTSVPIWRQSCKKSSPRCDL